MFSIFNFCSRENVPFRRHQIRYRATKYGLHRRPNGVDCRKRPSKKEAVELPSYSPRSDSQMLDTISGHLRSVKRAEPLVLATDNLNKIYRVEEYIYIDKNITRHTKGTWMDNDTERRQAHVPQAASLTVTTQLCVPVTKPRAHEAKSRSHSTRNTRFTTPFDVPVRMQNVEQSPSQLPLLLLTNLSVIVFRDNNVYPLLFLL